MASSAKTYTFFEGWDGEPKSQWQYQGEPTIPGVIEDGLCDVYAPPFRWVARAHSAKQGAFFVRESSTSQDHENKLGVWWDREESSEPPPLTADSTICWALESTRRGTPMMSLWRTQEQALAKKAEISEYYGDTWRVFPITLAEAKKSRARWSWFRDETGLID